MKPAIVFPFHDPKGEMVPHLKRISPLLKQIFSEAFLSITPATAASSPEDTDRLTTDNFFNLVFLEHDLPVGLQFKALYRCAARARLPERILHLCFIDRLAFALQTNHQTQFIKDVSSLNGESIPTIFQRSAKAWDTHPRNYTEVEKFVTTIGELLLGQSFDFAWCHLAIRASQLAEILPYVKADDLSMMTEIILQIKEELSSQDVDWLAWEDPFILSCDAAELKRIREESVEETQKRLAYTTPMVQRILEYKTQY